MSSKPCSFKSKWSCPIAMSFLVYVHPWASSNTRQPIKSATMQNFRNHPNAFVPIHSAGFRLPIAIPSHRRDPNINTFCRTTDSSCLWASIANAIDHISRDDATNFLRARPIPDTRFVTVSDWVSGNFYANTLRPPPPRTEPWNATNELWCMKKVYACC